jgi:hypothetical protein
MADSLPAAQAVLDHVPDPDTCRALLARAVREAELLRRLLKVAQRKAEYRARPQPVTGGPRCDA